MKKLCINVLLAALSLLALTVSISNAQPPDTLWTNHFGGSADELGNDVKQTSDGGFIIVGETYSFGVPSDNAYIIKTNSSGTPVWSQAFGMGDEDYAMEVIQIPSGDYVVVGGKRPILLLPTQGWLFKLNASGGMLWERVYGGGDQDYGWSLRQTVDGGFIIGGTTRSYTYGNYDFWLIKTDSNGNMTWNNHFGGSNYEQCSSVDVCSDGGYIMAGITKSYEVNGDVWLVKTYSDGNMRWNRTYGGSGKDEGYSIRQTNDGGYIIAGLTESFGVGGNIYLIKTNSAGDTIWTKNYGGSGEEFGFSVDLTDDGGYVVAGRTSSYGSGGSDVWVIKVDSLGSLLWSKTIGGANSEEASAIHQTSDGGYIVAGHTTTYTYGQLDIYLVRLGSPLGTISGYVTDAATSDSVAGASVQASGPGGTYSDPNGSSTSGFYEITGVTPGTYTVTASANGYLPTSIPNLTVTAGQTTTQNIALTPLTISFTFSPAEGYMFPETQVGHNTFWNATTITNTGNAILDITAVNISSSQFSCTNFPAGGIHLNPQQQYPGLGFRFAPTIVAEHSAVVTFTSNASSSPQVLLSGESYQLDSTTFNFWEDSYSFANTSFIYRRPLEELLKSGNMIDNMSAVLLHLDPFRLCSYYGDCWGMATSSIVYSHHPGLIPYGFPYTRMLTEDQASPAILTYQGDIQLVNILVSIFLHDQNQNDTYNNVMGSILLNHPVVLQMRNANGSVGHAIVAYRLEEHPTNANISIYDVNYPNDANIVINVYLDPISFRSYGDYVSFSSMDPEYLHGWPAFWALVNSASYEVVEYLHQSGKRLFSSLKSKLFGGSDTPDNIMITDQFGRRVGLWDGVFFNEIPGTIITDSTELECFLPEDLTYDVEYESKSNGLIYFAGLCPSVLDEEAIYNSAYDSLGVVVNSTASFSFDPTSTSDIEFDYEGDGLIDSLVAPLVDTLMTMIPPQSAPTDFAGQVQSQREISFTWQTQSTTALGSIIYKQMLPDTIWTAIYFGGDELFADTMLIANTQFRFRVCNYNAGGNSPYSDTLNLTTPPMPLPTPMSPADSTVFVEEPVPLSWSPVADAVKYHLQVSTDSGFTQLVVNDSMITGTADTLTSPYSVGWHCWRVRAADCVPNWSDWSETRSFFRSPRIPQEISDLIIERSGNGIVLSWSPVVSDTSGNPLTVSYYVILSSTESPPFEPTSLDSIGSVSPPDSSFTDSSALNERMRFYNVKAVIE